MSTEIVPETPIEPVTDTPSIEEVVTIPETTEPITQPTVTEETLLSDEEIDAAIEAILNDMPTTIVTEPTFFPSKEEISKEVDALTVMADEFIQSEIAKEDALKKVSDTELQNQELSKFVEDIKTSYSKISDVLGTDIADKITAGDTDIPLHLFSDKMEKVYAHPFFGPHIKTLLEGGEVDLPKLLKETLGRARIPNVADTPGTQTPEPQPQGSTNNLISRLRAGHRLS